MMPAETAASGAPLRPGPRGFTLIELVTVLAIIGILAAILVPVVGGAMTSAKRAKTRVQFSQWATALEAFRQEYGYWPDFTGDANVASSYVNAGADFAALGTEHRFHDILAARRRNGAALPVLDASPNTPPEPERQNPKRIRFFQFGDDEIKSGRLVDPFENSEIVVTLDTDSNGVIPLVDPPTVRPGLDPAGTPISPENQDVRASVIFYSVGDGSEPVTSW